MCLTDHHWKWRRQRQRNVIAKRAETCIQRSKRLAEQEYARQALCKITSPTSRSVHEAAPTRNSTAALTRVSLAILRLSRRRPDERAGICGCVRIRKSPPGTERSANLQGGSSDRPTMPRLCLVRSPEARNACSRSVLYRDDNGSHQARVKYNLKSSVGDRSSLISFSARHGIIRKSQASG